MWKPGNPFSWMDGIIQLMQRQGLSYWLNRNLKCLLLDVADTFKTSI